VSLTATLTVLGACPADITSDEQVNVNDLLQVIASWGACPQ